MEKIEIYIKQLVNYGADTGLIEDCDKAYATNRLLEILCLDGICDEELLEKAQLEEILDGICDYAFEKGLFESNSVVYRDLFDTKIMGALIPMPSAVISKFNSLYARSPEKATDFYYHFSKASNYIRDYRVKKDLKWQTESVYGDIDITINHSKPEKDPKAIAAAKLLPQSVYPKCLLCL